MQIIMPVFHILIENEETHIFSELFAEHAPKVLRNKHYDVDVKTNLHDVNYVFNRNGTTCVIPKPMS